MVKIFRNSNDVQSISTNTSSSTTGSRMKKLKNKIFKKKCKYINVKDEIPPDNNSLLEDDSNNNCTEQWHSDFNAFATNNNMDIINENCEGNVNSFNNLDVYL